jgi:hypothetical protein
MRKSPIVFFIIFLLFIPFFVFAYDAKTTHPNLTELTVDFYNQSFPETFLGNLEKKWLMQGSVEEDDGVRSINHFYDPVFDKAWQFGGVEHFFPSLNAKEWGQNPFAQAVYDPLYTVFIGPIIKSPVFSKTNFTWQRAIYEYLKGNKEIAFKSLGHILHLIQDMSVPEHTRQNVHIFFIDSANSPYELYAAKDSKSFYKQIKNNTEGLLPVERMNLDEYFNEIALYSNNYFYSPDTILDLRYNLPQPIFSEFPEIQNGKQIFYVLGKDENNGIFHLALVLKNDIGWRLASGPSIFSLEDDQVLEDYWQRLSKKAVLSGAGVINLFFQEVTKANLDPNFISKNEGNLLTAMVGGFTNFIDNIFQKNSDFIILDGVIDNSINSSAGNYEGSPTTISFNTTSTTKQLTTTTKKQITTTTKTFLSSTTTKPKLTTTATKLITTTTSNAQVKICDFNTSQSPSQDKIIINEVAWMGTHNNVNDEWIELKNISSKEIDISNWQLLDKDQQIRIIFEQGSKISTKGFYLLERAKDDVISFALADYIYTGVLNNANEGLRLFDNNCNLQDEVFADLNWPAGDNNEKRTMERSNDLIWHTYSGLGQNGIFGTPKNNNSQPSVSSSGNGGESVPVTTTTINTTTTTLAPVNYPKILINEIQVSGKDQDEKIRVYNEFIELFNPNNFKVDLTGWYLQKKTSQSSDFSSLAPSNLFDGKIINSLDYFVIAHSSSSYNNVADILISDYSITDNNTIILKNPNREITDKVGFGEANDCEVNCAINPEPGQSIQRKYIDGNFLDSINNANDFEIQYCPSPKSFFSDNCSVPIINVSSLPAIPYITECSWHPFEEGSSKIVIDFKVNSYPFIPTTDHTRDSFTAMAFYLHSDFDDPSVSFGVPLDYLGNKYNWELDENIPGLILSYPNYVSNNRKIGSIIFTTNETMAANSSAPRKLSYKLNQIPNDNHFVIEVAGTTQGQSLKFTSDQYVTIGYYGYDKSLTSYLKLIAYDDTKFYFNPYNYYHPPTDIKNFNVQCNDEHCGDLIFSWAPVSDEDPGDILKYDIHYVFAKQGDDLNNNDLTRRSWQWSASQNISGEPIFNSQENKFELRVPISEIYYINAKRLPGVPLDVFFGIKAQDSVGLKSEIPKIVFVNIPPIVPETTTTTIEP